MRGWASTATPPDAPGQAGHLGRGDPGLGHVGRPAGRPSQRSKASAHRVGGPVADQHGGDVGPAGALLARRLGHQLLVGDRDAELGQRATSRRLRATRSARRRASSSLEGGSSVVDEVARGRGRCRRRRRRRPRSPGTSSTPELGRPPAGREPGQGVVVGQGDGRAPGRGRQLGDPGRRVGAVGAAEWVWRSITVEPTLRCTAVTRRLCDTGVNVRCPVRPGVAPTAPAAGQSPTMTGSTTVKEACGVFGVYAPGRGWPSSPSTASTPSSTVARSRPAWRSATARPITV